MLIAHTAARLVDIPCATARTDAIQSFTKQETILVDLTTDSGLHARGYSYTIGTGGRAVLALLRHDLLPRLLGADVGQLERVWKELFWSTHATTVGPLTSLAIAAIDTALWDARSRAAGIPLWQLAGGAQPSVPLYDTDGGWLGIDIDELVAGARRVKADGLYGTKIKVGKPSAAEDVSRLAAVRHAVGPDFPVMIDANQAFTLAEARRRAAMFEPFAPAWFEEPMPAEAISDHALLQASTSIPLAVGESLYSPSHFREYLAHGGCGVVQVDVARIGGITPWLKVAHLAEAFNVCVAPHFLMELHVALAAAVPNAAYVEHIPALQAVTLAPMRVHEGRAVPSDQPGLGIEWDDDALDRLTVA
jgi:L-alanine-DL-glutamate epimerase-like enolase superfamily enzyme